MTLLRVILLLGFTGVALSALQATVSLLPPDGIKLAVQDKPGATLVGVHYSINKPLPGVAAGQFNFDINTKTNGVWVHQHAGLHLKPGDIVNYWLYMVHDGQGEQMLGQSWTVPDHRKHTTRQPETPKPFTPTKVQHVEASTVPQPRPQVAQVQTASTGQRADGCTSYPCVIFRDDFQTLDLATWEHEITMGGGGNWEFEYYTNNRSNSYVRDGVLYIKPTLTSDKFGEAFLSSGTLSLWGGCTNNAFYGCERVGNGEHYINPIQSARLRTKNSFSFRYGRLEAEAKMPTGDWIWPAIWMLPTDNAYGDWPASGEIDLVESRGNINLKDGGRSIGVDSMGSTLHFGPYYPQNGWRHAHFEKIAKTGTFGSRFHKYAVEWDEHGIRFYLDNEQVGHVAPGTKGFWGLGEFDKLHNTDNPWAERGRMAPFDQKFHIIMNVAVGGTGGFFPDSAQNAGYTKPWRDTSPTAARDFWHAKNNWYPTWQPNVNNGENAAMQVRYIQVTKLKADP